MKNYPDQYDVNLNEGIFRILAILCELEADFCATLMENPFFTTEIKDKFESSNSEVEQVYNNKLTIISFYLFLFHIKNFLNIKFF